MAPLARLRRALRLLRLRAELPLLFRGASLPELLERFDREAGARRPHPGPPPAARGEGDPLTDELLTSVERLFRPLRFWRTTCLWRALGGYAALRAAGADVRFLIGVRVDGGELVAHAWLERDGKPSLGAPGPGERYTVAFAWPADAGTLAREVARMPGIAPAQNVVLTELRDGTGVLLHLDTKVYFTLNRTGVLAWKLLGDTGARDAGELGDRLAREFPDEDPAAVRADVAALVEELVREQLVTRS